MLDRSEISVNESVDLASAALASYDPDPDCAVADLLANLKHYCRVRGIDFEDALGRAETTVLMDMMGL